MPDIPDLPIKSLVSSKEVLRITGISRATLNNYIKMGILPKPIVRRPRTGLNGVKQIGYFPVDVLDRIETVKRLKREGHSMEDIQIRFHGMESPEEGAEPGEPEGRDENGCIDGGDASSRRTDRSLRLTLTEISLPAYLANYDFEIWWINREAETRLFKQPVSTIEGRASRNIFKLIFNWEFQRLIRNWKDLITFHMAFAKTRFAKTWIEKLYWGISEREIALLEEAYDRVEILPRGGMQATQINLLKRNGTTESYRVYTTFFREGILFVYAPVDAYYHWEKTP
jgi:adenylate cyclase